MQNDQKGSTGPLLKNSTQSIFQSLTDIGDAGRGREVGPKKDADEKKKPELASGKLGISSNVNRVCSCFSLLPLK